MKIIFKKSGKILIILSSLLLFLLISMTACKSRYVVVPADETIQIKKGQLDQLTQDNELLLKALEECKTKK